MATVTFRIYEELNDFLPPARRKQAFSVPCARAATAKHMIEALGVPHTEVEVLLVNGESVGFVCLLRDGDRELLRRRGITHGCFVRALRPSEQLREVIARLDLSRRMRPFSRCLACNARLEPVEKNAVLLRLPRTVREAHDRFTACTGCGRVYWEGSHWRRMRAVIDGLGV